MPKIDKATKKLTDELIQEGFIEENQKDKEEIALTKKGRTEIKEFLSKNPRMSYLIMISTNEIMYDMDIKVTTAKEISQKSFCYVCGNKEITIHHMRIEDIKSKKKRGKVNGIIPLCRSCHDIVEDIVNKGKAKRLWYDRGFEAGKKYQTFDLEDKEFSK